MTQAHHPTPENGLSAAARERLARWKRRGLRFGLPALVALIALLALRPLFFVYVPPHKMLVLTARTGDPLPEGRLLAKPGEKGVQKQVRGEGWHFIPPLAYTTELADCIEVPPGKVGIVTALDGDTPPAGRVLALQDNEKGIRREVLTPGTYRLNPHGFKVEVVPVVEIRPGYIGVVRRLLGKENTSSFADTEEQKGLLHEVLQPGIYYVNTREYEVLPREVGIYQTSFHFDRDDKKSTALTFRLRDGNEISLDCTIEWEVLPHDAAVLAVGYKNFDEIEERIVKQEARRIVREEGFLLGAQEFLEGTERERFQTAFRTRLQESCGKQGVQVGAAYIRNIVLPERFLEPKRKARLDEEKALTGKLVNETILSDNEVAKERGLVTQEVEKVKAETAARVAVVDQETANVKARTDADLEALRADYQARMAALEAEQRLALGGAEAKAKELKETATSGIFAMKRDVYQGDGNAFLKASLAEQINPSVMLRLYQSGPGTFWTNLGDKNLNLMVQPQQPAKGNGMK